MREREPRNDVLLLRVEAAELDHVDAIARAGKECVVRRRVRGNVRIVRIDLELAARLRHADARDRAAPRDVGNEERGGSAQKPHEFRIVLFVDLENGDDHLDLATDALVKERPDRPVHEPPGEHRFLGRAAFAPDEPAADDLPRRVKFLLVINLEREVIRTRIFMRHHGGRKHDRLAVLREHRRIRLLGERRNLYRERFPGNVNGILFFL